MSVGVGDSARLNGLLRDYNEYPERRERIVAEIRRAFARQLALLVIDSSGFTRGVQRDGIIHFLALLERLGRLIVPIIERHGGRVIKVDADNYFAGFTDVTDAAACAIEVCAAVAIANEPLPAAEEIYVAIGVGFGEVLLVGDHDVFGAEMNAACKLGEDLAERGEILLTANAHAALPEQRPYATEEVGFTISGVELTAYRIVADSAR
ncbi:MAG: adenylate/guanylate cyclase domain-containing protein [Chloroflexota bacterium]